MEFVTHPSRFRYMVNDTKKEIFGVQINPPISTGAPEEIKNMDPGTYALLFCEAVATKMCQAYKWLETDTITRLSEAEYTLRKHEYNDYMMKIWEEKNYKDGSYVLK